MNLEFPEKFIPYSEMAAVRESPKPARMSLGALGDSRAHRQRRRPFAESGRNPCLGPLFQRASDRRLCALEPDCECAGAFVCLNRDGWNAGRG